jgi:hypothetical protein
MAVRSVRATRLGAEVPFALARWLLDPLVRAAPSVLEAGWSRHARSLFEGEASGAGDRRSLIEGLVALVAELHRRAGPLALIVDDAQWGDPERVSQARDLLTVRAQLAARATLRRGAAIATLDSKRQGLA